MSCLNPCVWGNTGATFSLATLLLIVAQTSACQPKKQQERGLGMAQFKQVDFENELDRQIRQARASKAKPFVITAKDLHNAVIKPGVRSANGQPASRMPSVCSAMRRRADVELPRPDGSRRGQCVKTSKSGNSSSVTYMYFQ